MPRARRSRRSLLLATAAVAVVFGAWLWREVGGSASATGRPVRVVVPKGASMKSAADAPNLYFVARADGGHESFPATSLST